MDEFTKKHRAGVEAFVTDVKTSKKGKHRLRVSRYGTDDVFDPAAVTVVGCADWCQIHGMPVEVDSEIGGLMGRTLQRHVKDGDWFHDWLKEECRANPAPPTRTGLRSQTK